MEYGAGPESAALRFETYARGMRRLTIAVAVMAFTTLVAVVFGAMALLSQPEPRYFATQVGGQILPLVPLNEPHLDDNRVVNFAIEGITKALTLNFQNWRNQLSESQIYFASAGYDQFLNVLESSGNLDMIRSRRMSAVAVANGGVVNAKGLQDGVFTWRTEIPLTVTYQSSSSQVTQNMVATVEVVRIPTYENTYGVGISRFVARNQQGTL